MKRIAELRKEHNLNQVGLGMKLNVSQKMISAYESGIHQPNIDTLKRMAKLFNVSVDYIIGNSNIRYPAEVFSKENLSDDEVELLNLYKTLSFDKKKAALGIIFALKNYNKHSD